MTDLLMEAIPGVDLMKGVPVLMVAVGILIAGAAMVMLSQKVIKAWMAEAQKPLEERATELEAEIKTLRHEKRDSLPHFQSALISNDLDTAKAKVSLGLSVLNGN